VGADHVVQSAVRSGAEALPAATLILRRISGKPPKLARPRLIP
jgi:hypothetical protein